MLQSLTEFTTNDNAWPLPTLFAILTTNSMALAYTQDSGPGMSMRRGRAAKRKSESTSILIPMKKYPHYVIYFVSLKINQDSLMSFHSATLPSTPLLAFHGSLQCIHKTNHGQVHHYFILHHISRCACCSSPKWLQSSS